MKNLNTTEYGIPDWPEFNEYNDGYTVKGFCRDIFDEDFLWIIAMFCGFMGILLASLVYEAISGIGWQLPGIIYVGLVCGPPGYCLFYFYHQYGKDTKVTFLEDEIVLAGRTTGRLPVLPDQISFRLLAHRKLRMGKKLRPNEREKLQDYGEIVLEYGLQTFQVCNIANLHQAQVFTRLLNEGFKRSQAMKQAPKITNGSNGSKVDPDDLPE
jgi:hypothetical protein